jgi:hypothetical protein
MKNIKIITRHTLLNYGSLLQSIATVEIISKLGYECQIIDYRRKDERGLKGVLTDVKKKEKWNKNLITKFCYLIIRFPMAFVAQIKFDRMCKMYLRLTKRYYSVDELFGLDADLL